MSMPVRVSGMLASFQVLGLNKKSALALPGMRAARNSSMPGSSKHRPNSAPIHPFELLAKSPQGHEHCQGLEHLLQTRLTEVHCVCFFSMVLKKAARILPLTVRIPQCFRRGVRSDPDRRQPVSHQWYLSHRSELRGGQEIH